MNVLAPKKQKRDPEQTRLRLIESTAQLMLQQGFTATTVDQICKSAGMTKGSFFHHFESKEAISLAAIDWWGEQGKAVYQPAWEMKNATGLERLQKMFHIMQSFTYQEMPCTCLLGMLAQEMSRTSPEMKQACAIRFEYWAEEVASLLDDLPSCGKSDPLLSPRSMAWFMNSLWQGSMLMAKNIEKPELIRDNLKLGLMFVDLLTKEDRKGK